MIYLDSTDRQIRDYAYELLRKANLPHLCDKKGIPNKPFSVRLRERIPFDPPLTFAPEAVIHFNQKEWPVTRNYTLDQQNVYVYN